MDPPILVDLLSIILCTTEGVTISGMPIDLGTLTPELKGSN